MSDAAIQRVPYPGPRSSALLQPAARWRRRGSRFLPQRTSRCGQRSLGLRMNRSHGCILHHLSDLAPCPTRRLHSPPRAWLRRALTSLRQRRRGSWTRPTSLLDSVSDSSYRSGARLGRRLSGLSRARMSRWCTCAVIRWGCSQRYAHKTRQLRRPASAAASDAACLPSQSLRPLSRRARLFSRILTSGLR